MAFAANWNAGTADGNALLAFARARALEADNKCPAAIKAYRKLLANVPNFRLAKIGLARCLAVTGNDDGAKFQLQNILSGQTATGDEEELRQLLAQVNHAKPFKYGFYASLLPSTNINTATAHKTIWLNGLPFTINETQKSGVGVIMGGWVSWRQSFTPTKVFVANLAIDHRYYPTLDRHLSTFNGSVGVRHETRDLEAGVAVTGGLELSDFARSSHDLGLRIDGSKQLAGGYTARASGAIKYNWVTDAPAKDGWQFVSRFTLDKSLSPTRFLRAFVASDLYRAKADRFTYDEGQTGIGAYNEFTAGISLYAEGSVALRKYHAAGPGLTEPRKDTRWQARAIVTKRDFTVFGLAPQVSYTFTLNASNSVFDDYAKHDVDVRLTKAF